MRLRRHLQQEGVGDQRQQAELVGIGRIPECGPAFRCLGIGIGVRHQRDVPGHRADAGNAAVRIFVDELVEQVAGIFELGGIDRRPEFGRLAFQHRDLGHHRQVGRGLPGAGGLLKLHQPRLAGGLGNGFDGDAGCLGEGREHVLVERILEIAAIDANLDRAILRAQDRRHRQRAGSREPGAKNGATADCGIQKLPHLLFSSVGCRNSSAPIVLTSCGYLRSFSRSFQRRRG